jgi:hypothetical protein
MMIYMYVRDVRFRVLIIFLDFETTIENSLRGIDPRRSKWRWDMLDAEEKYWYKTSHVSGPLN